MMNIQDFKYEVKFCNRGIALFVNEEDAIKFAKTKRESFTFVEVWDLKNDKMVYEWCY